MLWQFWQLILIFQVFRSRINPFITLNYVNIARSGISFDNNVTLTGSNNLTARYKVTIVKNFQLPAGSTLNINVNTTNNINCL